MNKCWCKLNSFQINKARNLILYGYKSTGKTYFGQLLSKDLGWVFIDTDQQIEKHFEQNFHEKLDCRQISVKIGEEGFRLLEKQIIIRLKHQTDAIISLGGGAVLDPENCRLLNKMGKLIYLEHDKEIIKSRILKEGIPSFLDSNDPEASFNQMYNARKLIYERTSSYHVNLQNKANHQVLEELKQHVF